jgi:small subunit ribosomal protein S17
MTAEAPQDPASEAAASPGRKRPRGRRLVGRVRSDKMDKTVVVETVRLKLHPVYKKYVRVRARYKAHDETNECRIGDRVEIAEHRPLSRDKRWKVVRVIERAVQE